MAELFQLVLLIHLLGAFLLIAAMALEAATALLLRAAGGAGEVRRTMRLARSLPRVFGVATTLIVASGLYMGAVLAMAGAAWGWMAVSLVVIVATALWSKSAGRRRATRLRGLLADSGDEISPALRAALGERAPLVHALFGAWMIAGVVVLMVFQPGPWIALAVIVGALLTAAVVGLLMTRPDRASAIAEGT
jgi:hypothetical protein